MESPHQKNSVTHASIETDATDHGISARTWMSGRSGFLFLKFGIGGMAFVLIMMALNTLVRGTENVSQNTWAASGESGETPAEGLSIMKHDGCFLCHRIDDYGGTIGPRLNGVKYRKTRRQLFDWIKSPHSIKPNTIMPDFGLNDNQIEAIISYLETKE